MLSIIVYGRYDNHGYNYHKRLAISLNCLAALLSGKTDEIIFVDYNTPDDLPTIVESIRDTLTEKAQSVIRILRVRPSEHRRFAKETHLTVLEPLARNVGLRRSNPASRWILSTNTDMIFVPTKPHQDLTTTLSELADGFYLLPRFEVPENLWEQAFCRLDPEGTIAFLQEHAESLHLNTIVRKKDFLQYDNPGDFQLMLRNDIFAMRGFDETMRQGWHVDSNLCKRMSLFGRGASSLETELRGYHCNHTLKIAPLHDQNRTQNSWYHYVESPLVTPVLPQEDWGLPSALVEEISLVSSHLPALLTSLKHAPAKQRDFLIHPTTFNRLDYSPHHTFTYLADHLSNLPPRATVVYIGCNTEIVYLMRDYLKRLNGALICPSIKDPIPSADLFIVDFGIEENVFAQTGYAEGRRLIKPIMKRFCKLTRSLPLHTKCVGISVNYTDFAAVFARHLSVRCNSHLTGISYGYTRPMQRQPLKLSIHYFVCRYLYHYSDWIRKSVLRLEDKMRKWAFLFQRQTP